MHRYLLGIRWSGSIRKTAHAQGFLTGCTRVQLTVASGRGHRCTDQLRRQGYLEPHQLQYFNPGTREAVCTGRRSWRSQPWRSGRVCERHVCRGSQASPGTTAKTSKIGVVGFTQSEYCAHANILTRTPSLTNHARSFLASY